MLRIARSLEAVHEDEKHHSYGCKPSSQACFVSNGRARSPDHKELVKEVLAQLGHGSCPRDREVHRRWPTPGPMWVRSADRREIQSSSSRTPSRNRHRDDQPPPTDVSVAEMAIPSATAARATGISPRTALQKGSTG